MELLADPAIGAVSCGLRLKGPGIDKERVLDRDRVTFDELLADRVMEVHSSTMLVRRAAFAAAGPVDEDIPGGYSEDYEWLLRLAAQTDIAVCREPLVVVDWHGGSFYFGRWATIVDAQRYLIRKHPGAGPQPHRDGPDPRADRLRAGLRQPARPRRCASWRR